MNFAWIRLNRLCGCNYKRPITRKGKSVMVADPHQPEKMYRLSAATFDAGGTQCRNSWAISPWNDHAERTTTSERNWQT